MKQKVKLILGIETSCDETSAAVVADGREILSNVVSSQIEIHRRFGGVVPEIASRNHTSAVMNIVGEALKIPLLSGGREADGVEKISPSGGVVLSDIDAIAVTCAPGLIGALLVGVSAAKALAYAANKPLIAVSHTKAHIAANYLAHKDLQPPFICLVVSGGHTSILLAESYTQYTTIGSALDDACGEAFDKVARVLGLQYPGGPEIDRLAKTGKPVIDFYKTTQPHGGSGYDFSYSGLKTAVVNYINSKKMKNEEFSAADIAASFSEHAIKPLVDKTVRAALEYGLKKIAVCGGVSANSLLRERFLQACAKNNIKLYIPPPELCTDNAAMVASLGYYMLEAGEVAGLDLNAKASER